MSDSFDKMKKITLELNCYESGIISGLLYKYVAQTQGEDGIAKMLLAKIMLKVSEAYYKNE